MKTTIILLTWKRIAFLKKTLLSLSTQTNKNFNVYISNANLEHAQTVEKYALAFSDTLSISVSHDSNEHYAFRRLLVAKDLAASGTEIIMFIDDDVTIPETYVEEMLSQYEPKTYYSGFCWNFQEGGKDYYRYRKRVRSNDEKIHYCGSGIAMLDASIFLDDRLFKNPEEAYKIEDLWLSYFAQHVMGWKLRYAAASNVHVGGSDQNALYKQIMRDKKTKGTPDKADFLRMLVKEYGWEL